MIAIILRNDLDGNIEFGRRYLKLARTLWGDDMFGKFIGVVDTTIVLST